MRKSNPVLRHRKAVYSFIYYLIMVFHYTAKSLQQRKVKNKN